jgi:hypothetical protein
MSLFLGTPQNCLSRLIGQVFSVKLFSGGAPSHATRTHEHAQQRHKLVVALPLNQESILITYN